MDSPASNSAKDMFQSTDAGKYLTGLCSDYKQLSGQILDGRFVLGVPIRSENHAVVFSVKQLRQDHSLPGNSERVPERDVVFEARIYDLRDNSPTLKRYRLRNMKRMGSRQVTHQQCQDLDIIVYKTGDINTERGGLGDEVPSGEAQSNMRDIIQGTPRVDRKTNYQRESDRLRQRDKRRAKRCRDAEACAQPAGIVPLPSASCPTGGFGSPGALNIRDNHNDHHVEQDEFDSDYSNIFDYDMYYDAPDSRVQSENLQKRGETPTFQSLDEAADFVAITQNELVSFQRISKQLPEARKMCHDQLGELQRQLKLIKTPDEKKKFQEDTVETEARDRILENAQDKIPDLIAGTKTVLLSAKEKMVILQADQNKREAKNLLSWLHHIVSASETYSQLFTVREG